jgi:hypothetical protein
MKIQLIFCHQPTGLFNLEFQMQINHRQHTAQYQMCASKRESNWKFKKKMKNKISP